MSEGFPPDEGMAPGAGLGPPDGAPGTPGEPVLEDPVPEGPDLADQMAQMQAMIEQQQQALQQLAPVAEYLQAAPQPGGQEQSGFLHPPDPFSENYPQEMERYLEQRDAQRFEPYNEMLQGQRMEELTSRAYDMISDVESRNGELLAPQYEEGMNGLEPKDLVLYVATQYSPEMDAKYGEGIRSDEAAIEQAYNEVKSLFDGIAAAHDARQQNQLSALSQAPREPGSSGIAAQPAVTTQPGGWDAFKARHGLL